MSESVTLKQLREDRNLTQADLAKKAGVALETLRGIETGRSKRPQPKTIERIANFFSMPVEEIKTCIKFAKKPVDKTKNYSRDAEIVLDRNYDTYFNDYSRCEDVFYNLSTLNADCDVKIFKILFLDNAIKPMSKGQKRDRLNAGKVCLEIVRANVGHLLNAARDLFEAMHGGRCAACIQILEAGEGRSLENSILKILHRDERSVGDRVSSSPAILSQNPLSRRIYIDKEDVVVETNLQKRIGNGEIITSSKEAGKKYNSVLIVPVPTIGTTIEGPIAALCIDCVSNFAQDRISVCIHFAKELAWRLAAMIYRMLRLEEELEMLR